MQVLVKVKSARYLRPGVIDAYESSDTDAESKAGFLEEQKVLNC